MTLDTSAVRLMAATDDSTARFCAGSVSLPRFARNTIGLRPFCCGANSRLRRSEAFWAPVPGRRMSLFVRIPKARTPAADAREDERPDHEDDVLAPDAERADAVEQARHRCVHLSCGASKIPEGKAAAPAAG